MAGIVKAGRGARQRTAPDATLGLVGNPAAVFDHVVAAFAWAGGVSPEAMH